MNKDEQVTETHDGTDAIAMLQAIRDLQQGHANGQTERIISTETRNEMNARAIYDLQQKVMEQAEQADWDYEDEEELSSTDEHCSECGRPTAGDHCQQCGLPLCSMCSETQAGFCKNHPNEHFEGYGEASITGSAIDAAIQDERMVKLERRFEELGHETALRREQRLQVAAQVTLVTAAMRRIEKLETCAAINAETIGQVEQLKVAMVEQGMRIEKLEAAIRVINRAWDTVAE